jgi:hypothetical protein
LSAGSGVFYYHQRSSFYNCCRFDIWMNASKMRSGPKQCVDNMSWRKQTQGHNREFFEWIDIDQPVISSLASEWCHKQSTSFILCTQNSRITDYRSTILEELKPLQIFTKQRESMQIGWRELPPKTYNCLGVEIEEKRPCPRTILGQFVFRINDGWKLRSLNVWEQSGYNQWPQSAFCDI